MVIATRPVPPAGRFIWSETHPGGAYEVTRSCRGVFITVGSIPSVAYSDLGGKSLNSGLAEVRPSNRISAGQ
jgi:hypothetical protein